MCPDCGLDFDAEGCGCARQSSSWEDGLSDEELAEACEVEASKSFGLELYYTSSLQTVAERMVRLEA
jgi:hypothetical protein